MVRKALQSSWQQNPVAGTTHVMVDQEAKTLARTREGVILKDTLLAIYFSDPATTLYRPNSLQLSVKS